MAAISAILIVLASSMPLETLATNKTSKSTCISSEEPFNDCESLLDDSVGTCKVLDGGDGVYQKTHRLEVKQECVNTTDVELQAVVPDHVVFSDLSIIFVNHTNETCRRQDRCQGSELKQHDLISGKTACLIRCPKRSNSKQNFEVDLKYGIFPTTWSLCDLKLFTDECASQPCFHGGECTDGDGFYVCDCAPGFLGEHCETNIDDCVNVTCYHGGTCMDVISGFMCACAGGFTGDRCQTEIDECESNPCLNGGTCADGPSLYRCTCADAETVWYEGQQCEIVCPPNATANLSVEHQPVVHIKFENTYCMEGGHLVSGMFQEGMATETNCAEEGHVTLGNLSAACIILPETCGPEGATISMWVNILDLCGQYSIVISSGDFFISGLAVVSDWNNIWFFVVHTTGYLTVSMTKPAGWFHMTFVYNGPFNGTLFVSGTKVAVARSGSLISTSGSGITYIGYESLPLETHYGNVQVDELVMWNTALTPQEVSQLHKSY